MRNFYFTYSHRTLMTFFNKFVCFGCHVNETIIMSSSHFDLSNFRALHTVHDVLVTVSPGTNNNNGVSFQPNCASSNMGKKSRVKIQKSGSGASAMVSPKEMMNLVSELLQSMFTFIFYYRQVHLHSLNVGRNKNRRVK